MSTTPAMPARLMEGDDFVDRYRIVRCIASGGMGAVYEATHNATKRAVALKIMHPEIVENDDLRTRFEREAQVTAGIKSEHIVETIDAGIDEASGAPYLVMEHLDGEDLASLLKRQGPLTPEEALVLLDQIALGLERTHEANIVHRDLKPENLFVTRRDDGSPHVKILDFGIAKVVANATQPAKTKVMGTPLYMAPEQLKGDGRIRSSADLYALGHIAFTMLTGRAYWSETARKAESIYPFLIAVMEGMPETGRERAERYGRDLPDAFDDWFITATATSSEHRFASVREMIGHLHRAFGLKSTLGIEAKSPHPSAAPRPSKVPAPASDPGKTPDHHPAASTVGGQSTDALEPSSPHVGRYIIGGAAIMLVVGLLVFTAVLRSTPEVDRQAAGVAARRALGEAPSAAATASAAPTALPEADISNAPAASASSGPQDAPPDAAATKEAPKTNTGPAWTASPPTASPPAASATATSPSDAAAPGDDILRER